MPDFTKPTIFSRDDNFKQVVFGDITKLLEVELNEMQNLPMYRTSLLGKAGFSDGFVGTPVVTAAGNPATVTLNPCVLIANGLASEVLEPMTLAVVNGDNVYLEISEVIVTGTDTLKKSGNQSGGSTIENDIIDSRVMVETSRRVQVQVKLTKTNANSANVYLTVGTMTSATVLTLNLQKSAVTLPIAASPGLTGVPTAPTAAADTNTTQLATTAFVLGQAGSVAPAMDGVAAVGASVKFARQDHVHPVDTSRAPLASPGLTGVPTAPTAAADTNTTQLATTAFVLGQAGSVAPAMDGVAAVGASVKFARQDHVHPVDTSRAPVASPTLTGTPASVTAAADTNTTQIATTAFVLGQAASIAPVMDGIATVGTSVKFARQDHAHPRDTAKAPVASPILTGTPTAPTAAADTNTTQIATTAFVLSQAGTANPVMDGAVAVGTSKKFARQDHAHPSDTSRVALNDFVNHTTYAVATGPANTYAVTLSPAPTSYVDGMSIAVKINVDSTGASTVNANVLGAIPIKDSFGNAVANFKAGIIYPMRYNATTGNFIVQGKGGGGNALASQLLGGAVSQSGSYTVLSDQAVIVSLAFTPTDITVTWGGHTIVYSASVRTDGYTIDGVTKIFSSEGGYVNSTGFKFWTQWSAGSITNWTASGLTPITATVDSGPITGTMPNKTASATVITPGTADQPIAQGYYPGGLGDGKVAGDTDLVPGNLRKNTSVFGVVGDNLEYGVNDIITVGKIQFQSFAPKIFSVATTAGTNDCQYFASDVAANELYCLSTFSRKVYVHDLTTGTLKRTLNLPDINDANYYIGSITRILVSSASRLYICGLDYSGYYATIAEINKTTGASIRRKSSSSSTNTIIPWLAELYNNEFYIGSWTGRIDVMDLELTAVTRSYVYYNSVGNIINKSSIGFTADRIAYAQSMNSGTPLVKLSDGTLVANLVGNNSQITCVTKNYVVVVISGVTLYRYDLNGILLSTITLLTEENTSPTCIKVIETLDNIIVIPYISQKYGFTVVDLVAGRQIFAKTIEDTGSGGDGNAYMNDAIKVGNDNFAMPFKKGYGYYKIYQKIV